MQVVRRAIAGFLVGPLLALGMPAPATADIVRTLPERPDRARIERIVARELTRRGVDAAQARARSAALTDREISRIAKEIDALPAGGSDPVTGAAVLIIFAGAALVLLVAIPIIVLGKLVKAAAKSNTGDSAPDGADESRPAAYPEPQY